MNSEIGLAKPAEVTLRIAEIETSRRLMGWWLLAVGAMILLMVLLGGVTRLTQSGLSIMEWAPLLGTLPPLSEKEWQRLFALYQTTLQFHQNNPSMDIASFRDIFWWEYAHRLWGRLIGLAFLLPFLYFAIRGYVNRALVGRFALLFAAGALQGLIGWYMVASGFEERVEVSQYRLALHLGMALLIYAMIVWSALDLLFPKRVTHSLRLHGAIALGVIVFEIIVGAFVAGLHGGLVYNNFPFMGDHLLAPDILALSPWWKNFLDNPVAVQFLHRLSAGFVAIAVISLTVRVRNSQLPRPIKNRFYLLPLALALQAFLGIATLMLAVPLPLAIAHQAGACLILSLTLFALHGIRK